MSPCMGFSFRPEVPATGAGSTVGKRIKSTGVNAARRKFTPEFINRLDKIVVVNPLGEDELLRVLNLELRRVQHRVFDDTPFLFRLTHAAKASLLADGFDAKYGARHRTISRLPDVQPDCRGPSDGGRSRRRRSGRALRELLDHAFGTFLRSLFSFSMRFNMFCSHTIFHY